MQINLQTNTPNFGKFIRVKGHHHKIKEFKQELKEYPSDDFISIITRENRHKSYLYIFSGKDFDKLIDISQKNPCFWEIRTNPTKFMNKKPQKISIKDAKKQLKQDILI